MIDNIFKRPIAVTMGDPAGVGPEIIVKACRQLRGRILNGDLRLLIVGSVNALRKAQVVVGCDLEIPAVEKNEEWPPLAILQAAPEVEPIETGVVSREGGRMAYFAVESAVQLAMENRVRAIVTAPLNKAALNLAGYKFSGHTDMLATLTGSRDSVMMLAHGAMHVSHLSRTA